MHEVQRFKNPSVEIDQFSLPRVVHGERLGVIAVSRREIAAFQGLESAALNARGMLRFGSDDASRVSRMLLEYIALPRWNEQRNLADFEAFGDPNSLTEAMRAARASMNCEESFLTWFAFDRPCDESGVLLIDHFLHDVSKDLKHAQRAYLEEMRNSCLRPYEVLAGDGPNDFTILRDLWSDDLIPLSSGIRVLGSRGNGMAFARVTLGADSTVEVLGALAVPGAVMMELLLLLRLMHQNFRTQTPGFSDEQFFKDVTPWILRAWVNSFAPPRKTPPGKRIVQLKVVLDEIRPQIWRRLLVPEGITLSALSAALEHAMGWERYHLHEFDIEGVCYGVPDSDYPRPVHPERDRRLSDFHFEKGARFYFHYDFGDGWCHRVIIEKFLEPESDVPYPVCVNGARACPPEDVGGPGGYRNFLTVVRNPRHSEHHSMKQWAHRNGRDFDAERFDVAEVNKKLRGRVIPARK